MKKNIVFIVSLLGACAFNVQFFASNQRLTIEKTKATGLTFQKKLSQFSLMFGNKIQSWQQSVFLISPHQNSDLSMITALALQGYRITRTRSLDEVLPDTKYLLEIKGPNGNYRVIGEESFGSVEQASVELLRHHQRTVDRINQEGA